MVTLLGVIAWASEPQFSTCHFAEVVLVVEDSGNVIVRFAALNLVADFKSVPAALNQFPDLVQKTLGYECNPSWADSDKFLHFT